MKTLALFLYHTAAALILNLRASRHANALRTGTPGSGQKLKDIGARSNKHEDAANKLWNRIKADPAARSYLFAVLTILVSAIVILTA